MDQSLADLLCDAFSETSVPSYSDGDLDFENLNFDEKFEEDRTGISHETKEDSALHQEATGQTAALSSMETKDIYKDESVDEKQCDKEDFEGVSVMSTDNAPEEDYTSSDGDSEQDGSVSGGDEEEDKEEGMGTGEKSGDLLMSVHCGKEFCDGYKEDRIFAEGQPLAPEGAENPQVRNKEQGESESDEEASYFERVPEHGSEMVIKGDGIEEDEQESEEEKQVDSDSECEGMKIEQEENTLALCFEQRVENPCRDGTKASLEFPEISVQNLQDLVAEVDSEEYSEKMKDFSGEEHQEAGESFADYPSDFSSGEYAEDGGKKQESSHQSTAKQNACLERAVKDTTWMGRAEDTDEEGDEYLFSRDLEVDADEFRSLGVAAGGKYTDYVEHMLGRAAVTGCDDGSETGESDSYSSSDDDEEHDDNMCLQDHENNKQLEETHEGGGSPAFARWSTSDDYNRVDPADFNINWNLETTDSLLCEDLLTTEGADGAETLLSHLTQRPAEDVNTYSVVQRGNIKTTSPSNQGSLDDDFFFNTELEASGVTEVGQFGDAEYEEERNWEQEQERIKAFNKFYDGSGENGREGRQIKVQFCANPLSQVIHYQTDSDRDSLSSSTEGEEDLSSAETSEELQEPDFIPQMKPACDPPNTQLPENEPDLSDTRSCTRKCLSMLKVILKMTVVIMMGLLMFWLTTDQAG
ncbi:RNA polymerase-associated protein LEO1 [Pempheris klunzingeri]|uniref:RNA polymerase-associated protein LEO1 n=1 Tax=Pempheris klunzingeri TaxID=3127111 RepID=UPI0039801702